MDETAPFSSSSAAAAAAAAELPPEILTDPMEFLTRSWSAAHVEVSRAISPSSVSKDPREVESVAGNPFSFASSATSHLILERIMSQSQQDVSPLTSGRPSHSSGPLSDTPPVSPSDLDELKLCRASNTPRAHYRGGSRTVGRWLKDRREKRKEETRAHNAQLHAAVSIAGLASAVASIASATAAASAAAGHGRTARADAAVASAATLVAAQCVEAAESMGAERDHLASMVSSAVSVRTPGDVATLTAAAATALRGAATLKARVLKEVWNMAAVIPVEKEKHDSHHRREEGENFVGLYSQELLARGIELLKRTRKGDLHWKLASVYIDRTGRVVLKTKSRHVAGTITKKKKEVVVGVCRDVPAWPGRHLLEGAEERRYLGLRTAEGRVIEFEFRWQREYDMFTAGVCGLLDIVRDKF